MHYPSHHILCQGFCKRHLGQCRQIIYVWKNKDFNVLFIAAFITFPIDDLSIIDFYGKMMEASVPVVLPQAQ